uniref:Uncharacterized protein n=1 Tax=Setaria italica TaxID=4555 RepID=K3XSS9_SETIT
MSMRRPDTGCGRNLEDLYFSLLTGI